MTAQESQDVPRRVTTNVARSATRVDLRAVAVFGRAASSAARRLSAIRAGTRGPTSRLRTLGVLVALAVLLVAGALVGSMIVVTAPGARAATGTRTVSASSKIGIARSEMAQILAREHGKGVAAHLPKASAPPPPALPSVAAGPPVQAHEVFGFAPYWTLNQATGFDVSGFTTIAYFALTANPNGTLQQSGTGWDGYESQAFANLVARAHAAGDRVVLTVNCFTQPTLNRLTSSPAAADTLAAAVVHAISAKNLDGVNLDFEGEGSADQAGLTSLVTTVADAVRAANPHYQVTMDTYPSAAGDPNGFYDIPALAPVVDAFFVMAYDLNLESGPSAASPLTSPQFSDAETAAQYAAAVPPSKVIFGTSFFGYQWPTTNGTVAAQASKNVTPTPISYGQVVASGQPIYWDSVTDTAWTSYEVGQQWYEDYVETPVGIYLVAQLAAHYGFLGVGAWALGMDGNDPQMVAALDDHQPAVSVGGPGPASTPPSATPGSTTTAPSSAAPASVPPPASSTSSTTAKPGTSSGSARPAVQPQSSTTTSSSSSPSSTTSTSTPTSTTSTSPTSTTTSTPSTTTTTPSGGSQAYRYSGVWDGQAVALTRQPLTPPPSGTPTLVGTLSGFSSNDASVSCLSSSPPLDVWRYTGSTTYYVEARQPTDCTDADFTFPASAVSPPTSSTSSSS